MSVKKGKKGRKTRNGHVFEGEKISVESFNRWGEQKKRLGNKIKDREEGQNREASAVANFQNG